MQNRETSESKLDDLQSKAQVLIQNLGDVIPKVVDDDSTDELSELALPTLLGLKKKSLDVRNCAYLQAASNGNIYACVLLRMSGVTVETASNILSQNQS